VHIRVLGAAAGGGFPQWNCNHPNSRKARNKDSNALYRNQSSIAISSDKKHWFILNVSPDIRQQIWNNPELMPKTTDSLRYSPIMGVCLTNADVDHTAGLLSLRESQSFNLYATKRVINILEKNAIFNILNPKFVKKRPLNLNKNQTLYYPNGKSSGISIIPFSVPGKVALWLEDESKGPNFGSVDEDTIALEIIDLNTNKSFFYIPGCASMPAWLKNKISDSNLLFFDGTLWHDKEMIKEKIGTKTGNRMGHMSMSGEEGTLETLKNLNIKRKIFIHINTTNPALLENSIERKIVGKFNWEIAYDNMEISL